VKVPVFFNEKIIYGLHRESLRRFGGADGVRDTGLVQSALGAALNGYHYGGDDLFGIAASYTFHIAQAQAFLDGNKRTATAAALVFLSLNEVTKVPDDHQIYDALIAIAEKRLDKAGMADVFRRAALSAS
jgi:death-on-curing protein